MKILVIGASGMLGFGLCQELVQLGDRQVVGTWRSLPVECLGVEMVHLDMSMDGVGDFIRRHRPSVVYHLAWDTSIELCEKDPVRAFHPIEVGLFALIEALNETGGKLVFVSTDSVFSDETTDRRETALPTPGNTYARSKVLAEGLIRSMSRDWVIARCCPVGFHPFRERGLVSWLTSNIRDQTEFSGWTDSIFTPLSVPRLSEMLAKCESLTCKYVHLHSTPSISKYEFLRRILKKVVGNDALIRSSSMDEASLVVPRPHNQSLNSLANFPFNTVVSIDDEIEIIASRVKASLGES